MADGKLFLYTDPGDILQFEPLEETAVPTQNNNAAEAIPTPAPSFPLAGVHTSSDVQRHFDEWPSDHKQRLADDMVVVFTYPHPIADWVGGAVIYHVPSVSAVILDFNGSFPALWAVVGASISFYHPGLSEAETSRVAGET
ncbi:MAG: hypothetical protein R6X34_30385 [Chloroflexota bacterium]